MSAFRGIAAILAGFAALPLLMRLGLTAVAAIWPDAAASATGAPEPSFMWVNLGLTGVMSAIAGAITAAIAPPPPYLWALVLAFLVFGGGLVFGISQSGGPTPTWYLLALPLVNGAFIAVGGWAWLARRGRADVASPSSA